MRCAQLFLKIDLPKTKQEDYVRCPFCNLENTKIYTKKITNGFFVKDYSFMNFMSILSKSGQIPCCDCDCGEKFDDQLKLESHIQNECREANYKCECGMILARKNKDEHQVECVLNFNVCTICGEKFGLLKKDDAKNHYKGCIRNTKMMVRGMENSLKLVEEQEEIFKEAIEKLNLQTTKIMNNIAISKDKIQACEEQMKKL